MLRDLDKAVPLTALGDVIVGVAGAETVVVGASLSLSDTYFDPFGNVLLFKLVAGE